MYAKVVNGQVTRAHLPTSGILQDGRTVSNYHLLPDETLLAEGWLPCEEVLYNFGIFGDGTAL